jgi:hypothetical protein
MDIHRDTTGKLHHHTRSEVAHHLNIKGKIIWSAKVCRLKAQTILHAAINMNNV